MKFALTFLFLTSISFACVCSGQISSSFSDFTSHIKEKLQIQSESLSVLTKSIQKNTENLKTQNTFLNKELALLKQESLQNKKLIFLFKQKNNLE